MDGQMVQAGHQRLHEALCAMCRNTGWSYTVFWRLRPRAFPREVRQRTGKAGEMTGSGSSKEKEKNNWVLMWEDGYSVLPSRSYLPQGGAEAVDSKQLDAEVLLPSAYAKMSYQLYNYGEGLIGKVALRGNHRWVLRDHINPETPSSVLDSMADQYPVGWKEQFDAGIQTIAVIAVPQGVLQLGSVTRLVEDPAFVQRAREAFSSLSSLLSSENSPQTIKAPRPAPPQTTSSVRANEFSSPALPPRAPPALVLEKLSAARLGSQASAHSDSSTSGSLSSQRIADKTNLSVSPNNASLDRARLLKTLGRSFSIPLESDHSVGGQMSGDAEKLSSSLTGNWARALVGSTPAVRNASASASEALASMKEVAERLIGVKRPAESSSSLQQQQQQQQQQQPSSSLSALDLRQAQAALSRANPGVQQRMAQNLLTSAQLKAAASNANVNTTGSGALHSAGLSTSALSTANSSSLQKVLNQLTNANAAAALRSNTSVQGGGGSGLAVGDLQLLALLRSGAANGLLGGSANQHATGGTNSANLNIMARAQQLQAKVANNAAMAALADKFTTNGVVPGGGFSNNSRSVDMSIGSGRSFAGGNMQLSPADIAMTLRQSGLTRSNLQETLNSLNTIQMLNQQQRESELSAKDVLYPISRQLQQSLESKRMRQLLEADLLTQGKESGGQEFNRSMGAESFNSGNMMGGNRQMLNSLGMGQALGGGNMGSRRMPVTADGLDEIFRAAAGRGGPGGRRMGNNVEGEMAGLLGQTWGSHGGTGQLTGSSRQGGGVYNEIDPLARALENIRNNQLALQNRPENDTDLFGMIGAKSHIERSLSAPLQGQSDGSEVDAGNQLMEQGSLSDTVLGHSHSMGGLGSGFGQAMKVEMGEEGLLEIEGRIAGELDALAGLLPGCEMGEHGDTSLSELANATTTERSSAMQGQQLQRPMGELHQLERALSSAGSLSNNSLSAPISPMGGQTGAENQRHQREHYFSLINRAMESSTQTSAGGGGDNEGQGSAGGHSLGLREGGGLAPNAGNLQMWSSSWEGGGGGGGGGGGAGQSTSGVREHSTGEKTQQIPRNQGPAASTPDQEMPSPSRSGASTSSISSMKVSTPPPLLIPNPPTDSSGAGLGRQKREEMDGDVIMSTPVGLERGGGRGGEAGQVEVGKEVPRQGSGGMEFPNLLDDFMGWPGGGPAPMPWQGVLPSPGEMGLHNMPWLVGSDGALGDAPWQVESGDGGSSYACVSQGTSGMEDVRSRGAGQDGGRGWRSGHFD